MVILDRALELKEEEKNKQEFRSNREKHSGMCRKLWTWKSTLSDGPRD